MGNLAGGTALNVDLHLKNTGRDRSEGDDIDRSSARGAKTEHPDIVQQAFVGRTGRIIGISTPGGEIEHHLHVGDIGGHREHLGKRA